MKQIILLSALVFVLADKIYAQNHLPAGEIADSAYTYFGVVYKDAFQWMDGKAKGLTETIYKQASKLGNKNPAEMPDRYKMIAELDVPAKIKGPGYLPGKLKNGFHSA